MLGGLSTTDLGALGISFEVLRELDITVRGRITGLLSGDHHSSSLGTGTEFFSIREYVPGDDVRLIDWNVTARTNSAHVRSFVAERALTSWLIIDRSPSMKFGTADRQKGDVAMGVCLAIAHAATRRNNRLGVVSYSENSYNLIPPRQGRQGMISVLQKLHDEQEPINTPTTRDPLEEVLRRITGNSRSRQVLVVVSDFRGSREWIAPMAEACLRHDVIAVEVLDEREQELPNIGLINLVDPETKKTVLVDTSSSKFRERFSDKAMQERIEIRQALEHAGADLLTLSTRGDWIGDLIVFMQLRKDRR